MRKQVGRIFGQAELLEAQAEETRLLQIQADEAEVKKQGERCSALARSLIKFCRSSALELPANKHAQIVLEPAPEMFDMFKAGMELPEGFDIEKLALLVSTLQVTSKYFELRYKLSEPKPNEIGVYSFLAKGESTVENYWRPDETYLNGNDNKGGLNRRIEFESPEFYFVRRISGLFVPNILSESNQDDVQATA